MYQPYTRADVHASAQRKRFTYISTFAGGGGSSMGYKLAGGHLLAMNQFQQIAADTYKMNLDSTHQVVRTLTDESDASHGDEYIGSAPVGIANNSGDIIMSTKLVTRQNYGIQVTEQNGIANLESNQNDWVYIYSRDPDNDDDDDDPKDT